MAVTFAFDIYGTLIDPHAIAVALRDHVGDEAGRFSQVWRDKQLEYTFRRALMGIYKDFSVVTADALNYACLALDRPLDDGVKADLLARYRTLAAFDDTVPALTGLREHGCAMYAFSNGLPDDLDSLVKHAGIDVCLDGIISVHNVQSFKPDPEVYAHFCHAAGTAPADTWLVSSNPFDIIGADAVGWNTAWLQRAATSIFDPWEFKPTRTISSLRELLVIAN